MERRGLVLIPDVGDLALFAECGRHELSRIRSLVTAITLPADETVLECGAPPRQFAVIADGEVVVEDERGHELAVLGPGDIVGELSLLRDAPTAARVRTLTPVVVYVGNRWEFLAMLEIAPLLDRRIAHLALDRLSAPRAVS
jgi:CRP/FNR family cyclic AMP-dependent transcriptional regulator